MPVDNPKVVDFIGTEESSGLVVLTITDHLPWDEPVQGHLQVLQAKLNAYLNFIESGEIFDSFPNARGRSKAVSVVFKFNPPHDAIKFLEKCRSKMAEVNIELRWEVFIE